MSLPYSVILKSRADGLQYDLSSDIVAIPLCTDTGSGEVNTAVIILSGDQGKYITTTPIIDQFDQIAITLIDNVNPNYTRVFEVRKLKPQETKDSGTKLEVHMVGLEANLQIIDYSAPFYFTDSFTVISDIANYYNSQLIGTNQPFLTININNNIPTWTTNTYDYGLNEDKCYNRIIETDDKLGGSVDSGGILDYLDVGFKADSFNSMTMNIFSSGSKPAIPITISNTNAVNIGESRGGIDAQTGTVICSWGANGMGSLPVDYSKFQSKQLMYPLYKQWDSTVNYPQNARVQWKGYVYLALSDNQNTQPDTHPVTWQHRSQADEYGSTISYSPWTAIGRNSWANSGCNLNDTPADPGAAPFFIGFWDGNLVLNNDTDVLRVPVDFTANSADIIKASVTFKKFLYGTTTFYRGLRVLCMGNPTIQGDGTYFGYTSGTAATAKDINGNLIANSVIQYDGSKWVVMYNAITNMMISNIFEGNVYQYDTVSPGAWGLISALDKGNDCFHPYQSLTSVTGVSTDPSFLANLNSAIQVKYSWLATNIPLLPSTTNMNYYSFGAWLNLRFPFPHNNTTATGLNVGQIYGGTVSTGCEPATIDSQNMHYTHTGKRGFNDPTSDDYGPLQDLCFDIKLEYKDQLTNLLISGEANFKMRCLIFDTEDNCVYQDFTIAFNGLFESKILPLSGFAIYRGLKPLWGPVDFLIPATTPTPVNVFNWRNIKNIVWQTQESYDSSGRYDAANSRWNHATLAGLGRYILLTIDSLRFSKPLFVTSGVSPDRVMMPDFLQRPNILFYDQLKNDALTELQKAQFRHKEYDITTTLALDIAFGDSFYFNNPRIVSDSDNGANTIKLVAKRIEYSVTKAENGQGGILRTIVGIKRFT